MVTGYTGILMMLVVGVIFGGGVIVVSRLTGRREDSREKLMAYECGIDPEGDARGRYSIKFYIVAVLFIVFDIEVIFLYPWAVIYRDLGIYGLVEMVIFIGILLIGFIYIWRKGALEWGGRRR